MKKKLLCLVIPLVVILGMFGVSGCAQKTANGYASQINIIVWDQTYSEKVYQDFQKKYGIKVNVSYISDTNELMTKLLSGKSGYDFVDIESAYVKSFVDHGLLQKIDKSSVPSLKNVRPELFSPKGDEKNQYTVPGMWPLYTGIIYNKQTCPITINTFADLANPKLKGQIAMVNSTNSLFGTALEALGYSCQSSDEQQIKQASDLLMQIKPNVKAFVGSSAESQLENGDVSVALSWDFPVLMQNKANWNKFAMADINSGYEASSEYWGIPKDSANKKEAELFMNFMLEPQEYAKTLTEYPAESPLQMDAIKPYLPSDYTQNPAFNTPDDIVKKAWNMSINDKQVSIMDKYYTQLMAK